MTVVRSVARSIVRSVASSPMRGGGGGVALDADALDYFSRAEGLGGSFDLANQIGAYTSDFSAGVDGWAAFAGTTIAGNIDDIGGRNDCLRLGTGTSDAAKYVSQVLLTVGVNNTVSLDIFIPSTNSQVDGVRLWETTSGLIQVLTPTQDQWQSFIVSGVPGSTTLRIQAVDGVATTITADNDLLYIRNVQVRQTSVATYTEAYVKTAISNFIAGCKTDLIWTKLTEVYLLTGVTFGGLMAKLKHAGTATLTNVGPFVTGDYLAAGSGAGLKASVSTKRLATGFNTVSGLEICLAAYTTESLGDTTASLIGNQNVTFRYFGRYNIGNRTGLRGGTEVAENGSGMWIGTSDAAGADAVYRNGSLLASGSSTLTTSVEVSFPAGNLARSCWGSVGTHLTPTDALNLSNRVNALMTALGANVY